MDFTFGNVAQAWLGLGASSILLATATAAQLATLQHRRLRPFCPWHVCLSHRSSRDEFAAFGRDLVDLRLAVDNARQVGVHGLPCLAKGSCGVLSLPTQGGLQQKMASS